MVLPAMGVQSNIKVPERDTEGNDSQRLIGGASSGPGTGFRGSVKIWLTEDPQALREMHTRSHSSSRNLSISVLLPGYAWH